MSNQSNESVSTEWNQALPESNQHDVFLLMRHGKKNEAKQRYIVTNASIVYIDDEVHLQNASKDILDKEGFVGWMKAETAVALLSNFQIALDFFAKDIPTKTEYTNSIWRPYFHKFTPAERKTFTAMCKFADAHHMIKEMMENNKYHEAKAKESYQKLFHTDGSLKVDLPAVLDVEKLKADFDKLFEKGRIDRQVAIQSRAGMIQEEIKHLKKTLSDLNKRD